jgi:hypothetical protein
MVNAEAPGPQPTWERAFPQVALDSLLEAVGRLLADRGYAVESTAESVRAVQETVLDARRRRIGKIIVGGMVALTLFTLGLIVSLVESRTILEWLLTIIVIFGGYGLMQLREPPKLVRHVVEVHLADDAGQATLGIREGVGRVELGQVIEWLPQETPEIDEEQMDALARQVAGGGPAQHGGGEIEGAAR